MLEQNGMLKRIRLWLRNLTLFDAVCDFLLLVFAVSIILPFMWIISTSFRLPKESMSLPPSIFPSTFNWDGYLMLFDRLPYMAFYLNSFKISALIVAGVVITATMAAYAFARFQFPGRDVLFILILSGLMIPKQVTIIPLFILIRELGLMDTHLAVIFPQIIFPLGIFLIRQLMMTIPKDYEEAAFIDGAGRWKTFVTVIVPMSMPAIVVSAVLAFIQSWNEFFTPLIFLNTYELMTLPLGMTVLQEGMFGPGNISAVLAGVTLAMVAPLLFYIFGQRFLVDGLSQGGIKS